MHFRFVALSRGSRRTGNIMRCTSISLLFPSLPLILAMFFGSYIRAAESSSSFLKNDLSRLRMARFTGGRNMLCQSPTSRVPGLSTIGRSSMKKFVQILSEMPDANNFSFRSRDRQAQHARGPLPPRDVEIARMCPYRVSLSLSMRRCVDLRNRDYCSSTTRSPYP